MNLFTRINYHTQIRRGWSTKIIYYVINRVTARTVISQSLSIIVLPPNRIESNHRINRSDRKPRPRFFRIPMNVVIARAGSYSRAKTNRFFLQKREPLSPEPSPTYVAGPYSTALTYWFTVHNFYFFQSVFLLRNRTPATKNNTPLNNKSSLIRLLHYRYYPTVPTFVETIIIFQQQTLSGRLPFTLPPLLLHSCCCCHIIPYVQQ